MTIIYLLNNLVNGTQNTLCEIKYKFYFYQNLNFIFIKKSITSLSKIKFYLHRKTNFIFIKNQMIFLIKYQILSLSKPNFIFIKNQNLSLLKIKFYLYQNFI